MKNLVTIHNLRLGLATNSSSSHSLIFLSKTKNVKDNYLEGLDFGWNYFTVASNKAKINYITLLLYQGLYGYDLSKDQTVQLVNEWIGDVPDGSIDHQSLIYFPAEYGGKKPSREFFEELKNLILSEDVVVGGGNDNDAAPHPLVEAGNKALSVRGTIMSFSKYIARKDEKYDYWTLFNPINGAKARVSFNKPESLSRHVADEDSTYIGKRLIVTRSSTPELVDYKITDFCSFNCQYCAPAGTKILTPNGLVNIEDIFIGNEVITCDPYSKISKTELVDQIYINEYKGDLIEIEMDDGKILKLTPNHEVFVQGKGWILAEYLEEDDELIMVKDDQKEEHRTMVLS